MSDQDSSEPLLQSPPASRAGLLSLGKKRGISLPGRILSAVHLACRSDSTILITGPTGTGKSSLAREIHENSKRKARPFVSVNLATLSEGVLESELFGHERGAFTGADLRRVGKLELAQGGTVFLDEVGELKPQLQARLLEFLQSRRISPVGGNREIVLNVRVIAATHRDLSAAVRRGEFREDLLHRLRVLSFEMDALKKRRGDLAALSGQILGDLAMESGSQVNKRLSPIVLDFFQQYPWPGNIRELRNVLEYGVLAAEDSDEIAMEHLPAWLFEEAEGLEPFGASRSSSRTADVTIGAELPQEGSKVLKQASATPPELGFLSVPLTLNFEETCQSFQRAYLERALAQNGGRISRTARQLGMGKSTLIRRIQALQINPDPGRDLPTSSLQRSFDASRPPEKKKN